MDSTPAKDSEANKETLVAGPTTHSTGKLIRAKDFLACFREKPDDLHLIQKFSLSPKQLEKVYQALIEKGLLTELEYHYRMRAPAPSEDRIGEPDPRPDHQSATLTSGSQIRGVEPLCSEITEPRRSLTGSVSRIESLSGPRISNPKSSNRIFKRSGKAPASRPNVCPKCRRMTDPCSPDTCISCGVVFSKFKQATAGQAVSIWEPDSRYR